MDPAHSFYSLIYLVLADSPPTICKLEIKPHFEALTKEEKLYAHHISRASFHGTRIILRQVSPESEGIYDLILQAYNACNGDWANLGTKTGVSEQNVQYWKEYAAQFLGNLGNYKVSPPLSPSLTLCLSLAPPVFAKERMPRLMVGSHSGTKNSFLGSQRPNSGSL